MDESKVALRYGAPTKSTKEPYLYQIHVIYDDAPSICYIQINKDESQSKWVRYSALLERALWDKLEDPAFVSDCIAKYRESTKQDEHTS